MLLVAVLAACLPARGVAQVVDLADPVVTGAQVTEEHVRLIREYVGEHAPKLESDLGPEIGRARSALIKPLNNPSVSVAFRQRYGEVLVPAIERLTRSDRELVAVNALRIAGELATTQSTDLLRAAMRDARAPVRFAAISALGRTFDAIANKAPAIQPARARELLDDVAAHLDRETDPAVIDAGLRVFLSAANVTDTSRFPSLRGDAVMMVCDRVGRMARAPAAGRAPATLIEACVRVGEAVRNALTDDARRPLSNDRAARERIGKAAAGLGGDVLALIARELGAGAYPAVNADDTPEAAAAKRAARTGIRQAAAAAEATIFFAAQNLLGAGGAPPQNLADLLGDADLAKDQRFIASVLMKVGPGGELSRPPFGFPPDRFVKP